jgi:chromosomal replication initiator protein
MNPFLNHKDHAFRIVKETARLSNQTCETLIGYNRKPPIFAARAIAIYLIRNNTDLTLTEIGEIFESRDHTTVKNAIKRAKEMISESKEIEAACQEIIANA